MYIEHEAQLQQQSHLKLTLELQEPDIWGDAFQGFRDLGILGI